MGVGNSFRVCLDCGDRLILHGINGLVQKCTGQWVVAEILGEHFSFLACLGLSTFAFFLAWDARALFLSRDAPAHYSLGMPLPAFETIGRNHLIFHVAALPVWLSFFSFVVKIDHSEKRPQTILSK